MSAFVLALTLLPVHTLQARDVSALEDLTAVIMLLGMPCGRVTAAQRQGDGGHIATCENGMRYRVALDAQGRVVARAL